MNMIVSDASPIISFARAGMLSLIEEVVGELTVPAAAHKEITAPLDKPGAREVLKASWITAREVENKKMLDELPKDLGRGEKEAIVLSLELGATLLVDDLAAREEARRRGLKLIGSIDILRQAKAQGVIPNFKEGLDALIVAGFWVSRELYDRILQIAGEE